MTVVVVFIIKLREKAQKSTFVVYFLFMVLFHWHVGIIAIEGMSCHHLTRKMFLIHCNNCENYIGSLKSLKKTIQKCKIHLRRLLFLHRSPLLGFALHFPSPRRSHRNNGAMVFLTAYDDSDGLIELMSYVYAFGLVTFLLRYLYHWQSCCVVQEIAFRPNFSEQPWIVRKNQCTPKMK